MSVLMSFEVDGVERFGRRHCNPDGSIGGWISPDAVIGKLVFIHPTSVIGPWGNIEDGAHVGPHSRLGMSPPTR